MGKYNEINAALAHITEWIDTAALGDKRVILRLPLQQRDRILLERCRELGLISQNHGRYLLEKAF